MFNKLSFSKKGLKVAKVKGGLYDGKILTIEPCETNVGDKELILGKDSILEPLYFEFSEGTPNRCMITGPSFCGKSYLASKIITSYKKQNKDCRFILLSSIPRDEQLDVLDPFRLRIDDSILEEPIQLDELHDSITLFDDIDNGDKQIEKELHKLKDDVYKRGRHYNIATISTSQMTLNGHKTRNEILNSFLMGLFPHSQGKQQIKDTLKKYCGMEQLTIDKIMNVPSRWVLISRVNPSFCLHDKGCFII